MKESKYNIISWILIGLSILFIGGSFFAPILITEYFSNWDFRNKGVIGDTIGGIMNPFIAIAGVCSTFVAFLMQVKANEIQKEQFLKSLSKGYLDEKLDAYHKLELVNIDIKDIIDDINKRFEFLDKYIEDVNKNPLATNRLERTVNLSYERFLSEDRTLIYKGFKIFLGKDKAWIETYSTLYHSIEYLPELYKNVYRIGDNMNHTTFEIKKLLHDKLIEIESLCVDFLNTNKALNGTNAYSIIDYFLKQYRRIIAEDFTDEYKNENDSIKILDLLTKCKEELEKPEVYSLDIKPLIDKYSLMVIMLNDLKRENISTLKEFDLARTHKDKVLSKLNEIHSFIENGIKDISVEALQKEYFE